MRISFANSPFTLLSHVPPLPFILYPLSASTPPPYHLYLGTASDYKFLMLLSPKIPHCNKIKIVTRTCWAKTFYWTASELVTVLLSNGFQAVDISFLLLCFFFSNKCLVV